MTLNGSGIRDISRVLGVCTETVMSEIKKETVLQSVNLKVLEELRDALSKVYIKKIEETEADEMWSFVGKKN